MCHVSKRKNAVDSLADEQSLLVQCYKAVLKGMKVPQELHIKIYQLLTSFTVGGRGREGGEGGEKCQFFYSY